jgi:peptide/nickel transport system permease protein
MSVANQAALGAPADPRDAAAAAPAAGARLAWRRFARDRWALGALAFLALLALAAALAPWIVEHALHHSAFRLGLTDTVRIGGEEVEVVSHHGLPVGPSARFPLGADLLGRDVLSRMLYGARVSLVVSALGTLLALALGLTAGLLGGFYRGVVDLVVSRFTDAMMAIPVLLLAIALASVLRGGSLAMMVLILALVNWTYLARLVRAEVLSLRERDFVEAARALGASDAAVMVRHLVPNLLGPVLVFATLSLAGNILIESALSFLGVGIQPPTPSWGNMIQEGVPYYTVAWWIALFPGLAILCTVVALNLVGDGLRRAVAGDSA